MNNTVKRFYELRADKVLNTFKIDKIKDCQHLNHWLNYTELLTPNDNIVLNMALDRYSRLGDGWNEEELKMHFISLVLAVADPNIVKVCKTFYERPLTGIVQEMEIHVICDCMIASPDRAGLPNKPYFFLQEYKQAQRFGKTDPEGQMLAAMLLAQETNQDDNPIYGSFIIERHWYFATFQHNQYCVSQSYNATIYPELAKIVYALRHLKILISNQ